MKREIIILKSKQIIFIKPNTAELLENEIKQVSGKLVKDKTQFSTVNCGTEKANMTGNPMQDRAWTEKLYSHGTDIFRSLAKQNDIFEEA